MHKKWLLLSVAAGLGALARGARFPPLRRTRRRSRAWSARRRKAPMEGVLVTAKKARLDHRRHRRHRQGRPLQLPGDRLEPGHYTLKIRAVGYDLDGAGDGRGRRAGETPDRRPQAQEDPNLAAQLTNAEWLMSMPGTEDQKAPLLNLQRLPHLSSASCARRTTPTNSRRSSIAW